MMEAGDLAEGMASARPTVMFAYDGQRRSTLAMLRDLVDSVVVPGTVATFHRQAVPALLWRLDRDYVIDPRTPLFQFGDGGAPKPSALTLARAYGEEFLARVHRRGRVMTMTADEWCRAAGSWALFQRDYAPPGQFSFNPPPAAVLPLYLMTDASLRPEWELNLAMLQATKRVVDDRPVWGVAALRSRDRTDPDVAALDAMLARLSEYVDTVVVWLDACVEHDLKPSAVAGLAELATRHRHITIHSLYGGYLSLLRYPFGWAGTSSGIGYSESRAAAKLADSGSGTSPPRYYLPLLHAFTTPALAETFIRRAGPIAECGCSTCLTVADGVAVGTLNGEQLAQHYVQARDSERRRVMAAPLTDLIADLRDAHRISVDVGIERIPSGHLPAWASGLENAAP
jgi:hypothetical protein